MAQNASGTQLNICGLTLYSNRVQRFLSTGIGKAVAQKGRTQMESQAGISPNNSRTRK
jgi:hypothetical protein